MLAVQSPEQWKHSDGYGLNLEVRHDGKFWFYAFRLNGKQLKLSLGSYPTVRLSDAREMHEKAWLMVQKGEDPREGTITRLQLKRLKDQDKALQLEQMAKEETKSQQTFHVIAIQWLAKKEPTQLLILVSREQEKKNYYLIKMSLEKSLF